MDDDNILILPEIDSPTWCVFTWTDAGDLVLIGCGYRTYGDAVADTCHF